MKAVVQAGKLSKKTSQYAYGATTKVSSRLTIGYVRQASDACTTGKLCRKTIRCRFAKLRGTFDAQATEEIKKTVKEPVKREFTIHVRFISITSPVSPNPTICKLSLETRSVRDTHVFTRPSGHC